MNRASPKRDAITAALRSAPGGMTNGQVVAATGQSTARVAATLKNMIGLGLVFAIPCNPYGRYFASAEQMEAARPGVVAAQAALKAGCVERRTDRLRAASRARADVRKAKRAEAKAIRVKAKAKARAAFSPAQKCRPKVASTKPAQPAGRKGWGPNDPMHRTPNTIYTFCPSPAPTGFRSNTHSQF